MNPAERNAARLSLVAHVGFCPTCARVGQHAIYPFNSPRVEHLYCPEGRTLLAAAEGTAMEDPKTGALNYNTRNGNLEAL